MNLTKTNYHSTESWVKAIKNNEHAQWLIAEAIGVTNLDPNFDRVVGMGIYPNNRGTNWEFTEQVAKDQSLSLLVIAYQILTQHDESLRDDKSWGVYSEAFFMLYNPKNHQFFENLN